MSISFFFAVGHDVQSDFAHQNSNYFVIFTSDFPLSFLQAVPFNTNLNFVLGAYKCSTDLIMLTSNFPLYSLAILVIFLSKQYLTPGLCAAHLPDVACFTFVYRIHVRF